MIDKYALARIICRAATEKAFLGLKGDGKIAKSAEPAVMLGIEAEINKKWRNYLPESESVLEYINGKGE